MSQTHDGPDCGISYTIGFADDTANDFADEIDRTGVTVVRDRRDPTGEVFAAIERFIPAAVMIVIAKKYFGTLIQEAAKGHYPAIRAAFSKLAVRLLKHSSKTIELVASPPQKITSRRKHYFRLYASS
jgi:hypothetical protein